MAGLATGLLDRRIVILKASTGRNEYGDDGDALAPLTEVWASVRPAPGRERLASAENAATALTVFVIRWSSKVAGVNPRDQIEYPVGSGHRFDIRSVVEIGRRDGLELAAEARIG